MGSVSTVSGQMEVMLHRNLNASDSQGPWPLKDGSRLLATLVLLAGEQDAVEAARPRHEAVADAPPAVAVSSLSGAEWVAAGFGTHRSGLAAALPPQLAVMSLLARDPLAGTGGSEGGSSGGGEEGAPTAVAPPLEYVLRLRHMYERGAHPTLSTPVTVDVAALLGNFSGGGLVSSIVEKTLTLAYDWATLQRRVWPTEGDGRDAREGVQLPHAPMGIAAEWEGVAPAAAVTASPAAARAYDVTLGPLEIKTLLMQA